MKKSIDLLGTRYTIRFEIHPCLDDGTPVDGFCDLENKEIVIDADLKGDERRVREILIHECFHGVLEESGQTAAWPDEFYEKFEEPIVTVLARWISYRSDLF